MKEIFDPGQTNTRCTLTPNSPEVYRLSITINEEDIEESIKDETNYFTYLFPTLYNARDRQYRRYETLVTKESEQKIINHLIQVLKEYGITQYTYTVSNMTVKRKPKRNDNTPSTCSL
jgi:hypothetical protein